MSVILFSFGVDATSRLQHWAAALNRLTDDSWLSAHPFAGYETDLGNEFSAHQSRRSQIRGPLDSACCACGASYSPGLRTPNFGPVTDIVAGLSFRWNCPAIRRTCLSSR